jgi:hypothetical protein
MLLCHNQEDHGWTRCRVPHLTVAVMKLKIPERVKMPAISTDRITRACIDPAPRGILNRSRECELLTADCHPITVVPGCTGSFWTQCSGAEEAQAFYPALPPGAGWQARPPVPAHWPEVVRLLGGAECRAFACRCLAALEALSAGAGVVVTGQQVGLLAGRSSRPSRPQPHWRGRGRHGVRAPSCGHLLAGHRRP